MHRARVSSTRPSTAAVTWALVTALNLSACSASGLAAQGGGEAGGGTYRVTAPAPDGYDRTNAAGAAREYLEALIAINTENPPGNELAAASYMDSVLGRLPGVERQILVAAEGRANLVARLRAPNASGRPVIVMGHMDVVGADTARWTTPPFQATERDGYVYGRGSMDDKGMLAATMAVLGELAGWRDRMTRDIILVATAGEEGGPSVGIDWILENHRELLADAEFALNEGGRIRVRDGAVSTVNIQTTEKIPYVLRLDATGTGGHGSVPIPGNPLAALARAVTRVHEWRPPATLNETTRLYFQRLATVEPDPAMARAMREISDPSSDAATVAGADSVLSREPIHNAVLRPGASLTIMDGGFRSNVIPSEGSASFSFRVLPDDDVMALLAGLEAVVAEPGVRLSLDREPAAAPPVSSVTTALYRSMERAATEMAPSATVVPFMSTGATDGAALRAIGIPTYGILPFPLEMEDELRMHGDDERIPVQSIGWATEYLYRVLEGVVSR